MTQSGTGRAHFTAPDDGTAYVYDKSTQRLVWSGMVLRGQTVDIDPVKNQIRVGGMMAANHVLNANSEMDIYFDALPPAPAPAVAPTTIVVPPPAAAAPAPNSNSVIVTPNATVHHADDGSGAVKVQPGLTVSPQQP